MKKILLIIVVFIVSANAGAQDFNKHLATARSSYSSGKLEDARFAMQQMIQEIDMMTGKDVLKMLPSSLETLAANTGNDDVSGASGFAGVVIHRDYGAGAKTAAIDIIGNSPLIAGVNAILSLPFAAAGGGQKVIKLDGYKALLQKNTDSETNKVSYELQVPLNSSLLTLKTDGYAEEEFKKLAAAIPVGQLAKTLQ